MPNYPIDFTQWSTYQKCPMLWYETYVNGWRKAPKDFLRDDALCIGSLYHDGQEQMLRTGQPNITQAVIDEMTPKPEALDMVRQMLAAYRMWAGNEPWQTITIEKPLEFSIKLEDGTEVLCMAKLDASVLVLEDCTIPSGLPGQVLDLKAGYYTFEHKTKAASANRAAFIRRWETDGQPLFQQYGLRQYLRDNPQLPQLPVHGTIINVAEKPNIYIPVRTCKGCKSRQDMSSYAIRGSNYVCPLCGFENEFAAAKSTTQYDATTFYRLLLPAHDDQLIATHTLLESIVSTYANMQHMRQHGPTSIANPYLGFALCIHPIWGPCHLLDAHTGLTDISNIAELIQVDTTKYMKESTPTNESLH